ncbi:MAG TPA: type II secretion system F family protein [Rhizomicrobium sp.]|jgi:tight adherence protein B
MLQSLFPIIYVVVFVAVLLAIQAGASVLFSSGDRKRSINRRLEMLESGMSPGDVYSALIRKPSAPFAVGSRISDLHDRVWTYFRQAGLSVSPLRVLAIVVGAALGSWLLSLLLMRTGTASGFALNAGLSLAASFVMCALGAWLWMNRRRSKRMKALEEQMPLALDVINRAIRAGHPVVSAVQLAANEMGDPIGSEFGLIVDETTYGLAFKDALANFAHRTGSPDAHFFSVSVGIQSETGGNLAEILAGLATVIRGRGTLTKRVKALSSEGRASALLLSALPAMLISALFAMHPTFYTSKFSDPIFWPVVAVVAMLYVLGWFMIRRIVNFKY